MPSSTQVAVSTLRFLSSPNFSENSFGCGAGLRPLRSSSSSRRRGMVVRGAVVVGATTTTVTPKKTTPKKKDD